MFVFERDYDWKGLVVAMGPEGHRWVDIYIREAGGIRSILSDSAAAIRHERFDQSLAFLEKAESERRKLERDQPSLFHVIGRFYFGGLAYHHFRREDFDRADQAMIGAQESIRSALELEPCLLPFAAITLDIPMKRARIARARLRWVEMREHSAALREAASDRKPLCTLFGRKPVYHSTIAGRLAVQPDIEEKLIPAIRYLEDKNLREEISAQLVGRLYLLPGLLIDYPGSGAIPRQD